MQDSNLHFPRNNLNLCIKYRTFQGWSGRNGPVQKQKKPTAYALLVIGSVFMQRFRLFLGQYTTPVSSVNALLKNHFICFLYLISILQKNLLALYINCLVVYHETRCFTKLRSSGLLHKDLIQMIVHTCKLHTVLTS